MHPFLPLFAFFPLWRAIFWLSYGAWGLFEVWVFSRDRRAVTGEKRDSGSLYVLVTLIVLGILLAFTAPHIAPFARVRLAPALLFFGAIALMWFGMMLRLWAIQTLGRFFRTSVFVLHEHRLVTAGPYRLLRHPAYSGAIMTITGIGVAMGNWISILGALLCAIAGYGWRMRVEERALRERFGAAFEQNRRRTWALVPFVW